MEMSGLSASTQLSGMSKVADAVRSISLHRLQAPAGHLSEQALAQIAQSLMLLLNIGGPIRTVHRYPPSIGIWRSSIIPMLTSLSS